MLTPEQERFKRAEALKEASARRRKAVKKWQASQRQAGLCINHSQEPIAPGNANVCQKCVDRSLARTEGIRADTWAKLLSETRVSFTKKDKAHLKHALSLHQLAITPDGIKPFSHTTQ